MIRQKNLHRKSSIKFLFILLILTPIVSVSEHFMAHYLGQGHFFTHLWSSSTAIAQSIRPDEGSLKFYQRVPDFPTENNYISVEKGEIAIENTLVNRLIRYHQYVKSRPLIYRLDWKLTVADYLGKNEIIQERRYPGNSTLTENPLKNDRQIIQNLTREQRDNLVNTLVSIYNPTSEQKEDDSSVQPESIPNEENEQSPGFKLPQPGGADLLLP